MKILAIDAASATESVALWIDGAVSGRSAGSERGAGEQLLGHVDELLAAAGLALGQLDAIAFGRGPGGFTGLRLAASLTQGLAFAARLPVLPVSNLEAVAWQAVVAAGLVGPGGPAGPGQGTPAAIGILACQDARMGEAYWAAYEWSAARPAGLSTQLAEAVSPPGRLLEAAAGWLRPGRLAAGSALAAYPQLAAGLEAAGARCLPTLPPVAAAIATLAAARGLAAAVPAEQAVPVYVRDDVARPSA